MQYIIKLKNGELRKFEILKTPLYPCRSKDVGETVYKTITEVDDSDGRFTLVEPIEAHFLYDEFQGLIADEGIMFSIFRSLRNPIVELKMIDE